MGWGKVESGYVWVCVGVGSFGIGFHLDRELRHVFQEHDLQPDAEHQALVGQPVVQGGALAPRQKAQELHVGERDLVGVGVGVGVVQGFGAALGLGFGAGLLGLGRGCGVRARVRVRVSAMAKVRAIGLG